MSGRAWVIVSHGGTCECGGKEDVIKWKNTETGETVRVCGPCNEAAAAARNV